MPATRAQNKPPAVVSPKKQRKIVENKNGTTRKPSMYSIDSDSGDELDEVGRRKYEEIRLKNLKDNAAFFSKLGIDKLKSELSKSRPKASSRGLKTQRQQSSPARRRSSLRLRRIDPDGVPLPPEPAVSSTVEENFRVPSGPLKMSDILYSAIDAVSERNFMRRLRQNLNQNAVINTLDDEMTKGEMRLAAKKLDRGASSKSSEFSNLRLSEDRVARVVPTRIFSITVHPTEDMVLVAAGGKWGRIGLWDVNRSGLSKGDGVVAYSTHSSPVNCLHFHKQYSQKLFSCSYDGTLRCLNFTTGIADEIYRAPDTENTMLRNFDFLSPHTLVVSQSNGCVAVLDTRTDGTDAEHIYLVEERGLRTVSVHPKDNQYFTTACINGNVCVWDLRKMKVKTNHSLQTLSHGRSVSSAYFSPGEGKYLLTTSLDNRICLYDAASPSVSVELRKSIVHDNHVGRWLTQFRSTWHPTRDDVWVSGSMEKPRQIELFNTDGKIITALKDEFLKSVCSLNSFHPSRNILAGGNASGRVHVFM